MHTQRQRYILFEYKILNNSEELDEKKIIRAIWSSLTDLFGEYYSYKSGLWMIRFSKEECWGIIRCNNITKSKVICSIALINNIDGKHIVFHTIKTSGTIKKIMKIKADFFSKHRKLISIES